tara:strand:- start:1342 stop:1464 length:123 start_codon:yes stop_codon:yes gene_type:complete
MGQGVPTGAGVHVSEIDADRIVAYTDLARSGIADFHVIKA